MANPVGRPLKFSDPKELQKKIDAYFAECDPHVVEITEWVQARDTKGQLKKDSNGLNYLVEVTHKVKTEQVPYTITGLALFLDTNRQTLLNYEEGEYLPDDMPDETKQELFDTIKKAKAKIEHFTEQRLFEPSPVGTIFNLKNNYAWKDRTETDITSGDKPLKGALVEFVGDEPASRRED